MIFLSGFRFGARWDKAERRKRAPPLVYRTPAQICRSRAELSVVREEARPTGRGFYAVNAGAGLGTSAVKRRELFILR